MGFELTPLGLNSSTGRETDLYPERASLNPIRVNTFQLTLAVSDYHEKFLFTYISEDDSKLKTNLLCLASFNPSPPFKISHER